MREISSAFPGEITFAHLHVFCFPNGEEVCRSIRGVRTTQTGELRMSPEARWIPFTASEFIDATSSCFRWEARLDPGKIGSPTVIDSYENRHGCVAVRLGGVIPLKKITGPDVDKAEIQRYLASILFCPTILLKHPTLEWVAVGPYTLRVGDRQDPTGAKVDIEMANEECPFLVRTMRPRLVGKKSIVTPWVGMGSAFREKDGMRIPTRLEVAWELAEGTFDYFRCELTSFTVVK